MKNNYWQEYFDNVSPTYMENWYEDLKDLTIGSRCFQIFPTERKALLDLFDMKVNIHELEKVKLKLRWAFKDIGGEQFFVRLGSRSPKDNPMAIKEPQDVINSFCESERILEDLTLAERMEYSPYIFVRKWIDIPGNKEFRCFVKNGELKGISQYYYRTKYYYLDNLVERKLIEFQARNLLTKIKEKFRLDNFIFDICYQPDKEDSILIEINPYSIWTDPCLFDWATDNFKKFEFKWLEDISKPQLFPKMKIIKEGQTT